MIERVSSNPGGDSSKSSDPSSSDSNNPIKPVADPRFWRYRINEALALGHDLHTITYYIDPDTWNRIQEDTGKVLRRYLKTGDRVLDAACGYGPLLDILPEGLAYLGVDISPDLLEIGNIRHPEACLKIGDLKNLPYPDGYFDWVICRSTQIMVVDNLGQGEWDLMEEELLRVGKQLLLMDYDSILKPVIKQGIISG